ncbi:MAG: hypothetical protein OER21_13495 [Gemmatimonadota bacterium]|nr:hypothetical protein [Gemmatimonadota bacterium]
MRTAVLLLAALASANCLAAQDVLLRMRPPQGQVTHYLMTVETFVRGGPMAEMAPDPDTPFARMTGWNTSTVTAVAADGYTERVVIDSVRLEFPAAPQLAQMMGQMGDLMAGTVTESRMSSRGKVLGADFTPSPALRDMMGQMGAAPGSAGQMGIGGGAERLNLPSFWLLPEAPVRVGAVWRDSMTVALDSTGVGSGAMRFAAAFTLRAMQGRVAVVGVDGTLGMSGAELPTSLAFTITGEVRLDLAAGRAASIAMEMDGSTPTPMGEMPMTIRTTMTAR